MKKISMNLLTKEVIEKSNINNPNVPVSVRRSL